MESYRGLFGQCLVSDGRVPQRIHHNSRLALAAQRVYLRHRLPPPPHEMSEPEDRKAKAARAKALVRTLPDEPKLFPFLTIRDHNSSRRGNKPRS